MHFAFRAPNSVLSHCNSLSEHGKIDVLNLYGKGIIYTGFWAGVGWGGVMKGTWRRTHANIPQVFVEIRKEQLPKVTSCCLRLWSSVLNTTGNKKCINNKQCVSCRVVSCCVLWITTERALLYRLSVSLWNVVLSSGRNNDSGTLHDVTFTLKILAVSITMYFFILFAVYDHVHPHNNVTPLKTIKRYCLPPVESLSVCIYWQ